MPDEKSEDVFNNPEDDGIPDDEEEELVEDSQDTLSQSRQSTSTCYSEEFENSYMTDLDHTLPPEMRKHRGEEGKVEKIREANDTLNQNPAVDTAIINDANRFRSPVKVIFLKLII
uniref:Uncharacterized protein n=1 Tax=Caenorhabditis japonica TaxID=281687 RepID=A0A8R1EQ63_CAEJA